jgi:hypothetical protein
MLALKNKTKILIILFFAALFVGFPYYEGMKKNKKKKAVKPNTPAKAHSSQPIPDEPQAVFEKVLNMGNKGERYDIDPMPFARKNPIQVCKDACIKLGDCVGFTTDKENELCFFMATKGEDFADTNMASFWKK